MYRLNFFGPSIQAPKEKPIAVTIPTLITSPHPKEQLKISAQRKTLPLYVLQSLERKWLNFQIGGLIFRLVLPEPRPFTSTASRPPCPTHVHALSPCGWSLRLPGYGLHETLKPITCAHHRRTDGSREMAACQQRSSLTAGEGGRSPRGGTRADGTREAAALETPRFSGHWLGRPGPESVNPQTQCAMRKTSVR